ncbi:AbrB family transcriptional regulator [Aliiroseovarius sp. YM-037]|uniref:AbrB family transcriptional regulator n=1 Tax=Aliiroseovarius sp. YM-037 TaxID=3341728 RepID=UPI003A809787
MQVVLTTLLIGVVGAVLAWVIGAPAPFLTGPAALVSLAGVFGVTCRIPTALRDACFLLIGITLGSSVTPEVLSAARAWPISLIGMCAGVAVIMYAGSVMFQRVFGFDRNTALLASSPGHLSYVLSFSTDIGANTAVISVIQSMRVLILTLMVPILIGLLTDADMTLQIRVGESLSLLHLGLLAAMSFIVGLVMLRLRVPAAFLLAGMICSGIGHSTGLTPGVVMQPLSIAAFVIMGTLIGTRFSGVTPGMLRHAAIGGFALTFVGLLISFGVAILLSKLTGISTVDMLIGIAPGGLETMVAMGAILGADPAFVAIHHVMRLLFLSVYVPAVLALKRSGRRAR